MPLHSQSRRLSVLAVAPTTDIVFPANIIAFHIINSLSLSSSHYRTICSSTENVFYFQTALTSTFEDNIKRRAIAKTSTSTSLPYKFITYNTIH